MQPIVRISASQAASLTLSELIEYHHLHNPEQTYAVFPGPTDNPDSGPERITFLEFARASHRFVRAVCKSLHVAIPLYSGEVVGVIANVDTVLYITAVAGLVCAGFTVFPISPRNSPAAIAHLLRTTGSHKLLVSRESLSSLVEDVQAVLIGEEYDILIQELPFLDEVYPLLAHERAEDPFEPVDLSGVRTLADSPLIIIHSSGSTGFPKPIPWTLKTLQNNAYSPMVTELEGCKDNLFIASPGMPPFHAASMWLHLLSPLYSGRPATFYRPVHPSPPVLISPETLLEALRRTNAVATLAFPSILESWVHDPRALEYLCTLDFVLTGGGPLASDVGDALVRAGCKLYLLYGATEIGFVTNVYNHDGIDASDWAWMRFPDITHTRWVAQGDESNAVELHILAHDKHDPAVHNLHDVRGYATKDLFIPHPEKPGLYRIIGRTDDVITMANAEKVVPSPTEMALVDKLVTGAVMFGRGRNSVGILLEIAPAHAFDPSDPTALAAFRNQIWPKVDKANRLLPAFGHIFKEMILVARQDKPLPRVAKGTVSNKAALLLYEKEINDLYHAVEHPQQGAGVSPPAEWTKPNISSWLFALASSVRDGATIDGDTDLFVQGYDSLTATFLRNHIRSALRGASIESAHAVAAKIGNSFVYSHPTIAAMTEALSALVDAHDDGQASGRSVMAVRAMIDRYSDNIPEVTLKATPAQHEHVILLTGSTGGLGSQLLADALINPAVTKVYALNRPSASSIMARHEATFNDRGLDVSLLVSEKLVFIESDLGDDLGIAAALYEEVRSTITLIIHNAWRLDFNLSLSAFEPNVRGTRRLIDLALTSAHASSLRFLFTSSVGVTQAWPASRGPFPEESQEDLHWCIGSGYGEGKQVSERLLIAAAKRGLQTTSLRLGQITGGYANGAWATTDWVPLMIKSSVTMGFLPMTKGMASWLPFDAASQAIIDIALSKSAPALAMNLVHPHPVEWNTIMHWFADAMREQGITAKPLPLVDVQTWVEELTAASHGATDETLRRLPAIKVLDFFTRFTSAALEVPELQKAEACGFNMLATDKAQAASQRLRELKCLQSEDVARWITYWHAKGFFETA